MSLTNNQARFPFEYCAGRYLGMWQAREKAFHSSLSAKPTTGEIVSALRYFRVARNFKGLGTDPTVAADIKRTLLSVRAGRPASSPVAMVERLTDRFEDKFEKRNLSAASKLLWLSSRSPYVLYDSRAVTALLSVGYKGINGNYDAFFKAWQAQYALFRTEIKDAVKRLPLGRTFIPRTKLSDEQMSALASKRWFTERVFDVFLWEVGGQDEPN